MATISKMEAVRKALSELSKDAQPVNIQSWVKQKFGLAMSTAHVSNYKTVILRKQSGAAAPAKHAKPMMKKPEATKPMVKAVHKPVAAPVKHSAPSMPAAVKASGIKLTDIETVKTLVIRVGENNLKSLIELLS